VAREESAAEEMVALIQVHKALQTDLLVLQTLEAEAVEEEEDLEEELLKQESADLEL
jgi:hypothetical protein